MDGEVSNYHLLSEKIDMVQAITYGDAKYRHHVKLNLLSAKLFGRVDQVRAYSPKDIDPDFYNRNRGILDQPRGAGYWLWKPYIINHALTRLKDGDFLIYSDAGTVYIRSVNYLIQQMISDQQNIMLCVFALPNKDWCKADCYEYLGVDPIKTQGLFQLEGTYMLIRKCDEALKFIKEWLEVSQDERVLTDSPDVCGKDCAKTFIEHRHDQAILTLLAYKYGITPYKSFARNSDWIIELLYGDYVANNGKINNKKKIFYQYFPNQIVDLVLALRKTKAYKKSHYPQIIVNVRVREYSRKFYWKAFCVIVGSLCLQINKETKEKKILKALGYKI